MDVLKFYAGLQAKTQGLPDWNQLHPTHQHMIVQACNLLLQVCYDTGTQGKQETTETTQ